MVIVYYSIYICIPYFYVSSQEYATIATDMLFSSQYVSTKNMSDKCTFTICIPDWQLKLSDET
jgi:hypothetical protein